jgi:hypothetical protein
MLLVDRLCYMPYRDCKADLFGYKLVIVVLLWSAATYL